MAARSVSIHLIPLSLNCQKKTKLTLRSVSSGAKLVVAFFNLENTTKLCKTIIKWPDKIARARTHRAVFEINQSCLYMCV